VATKPQRGPKGIHNAILSGILAAEKVAEALAEDRAHE
jgi:flavin-dependent dehydrogenase